MGGIIRYRDKLITNVIMRDQLKGFHVWSESKPLDNLGDISFYRRLSYDQRRVAQ